MINHIAVDIGASSGRLVLGRLEHGVMQLTELHRFPNQFQRKGDHLYWDIDQLFNELIIGLSKAKQAGIEQCTLGIDTWAVDYVLLDAQGERLHDVYAYRDARTNGAPDSLHQHISRADVYRKTGIQELPFNTLYQLYVHDKEQLSQTDCILFVPDYLYYRLTGKKINEVTNASTSQLINLTDGQYDEQLLELLKLSREQFAELVEPGTVLGPIKESLRQEHQLPQCECIVVPTHDTASAVVGVPATGERPWAFISSGTWSLLGMELRQPIHGAEALAANYTNERGAFDTYRFLKNIMGLWMLQEVRRLDPAGYGFAELVELAAQEQPFVSLVRCNDDRFLNPEHMIKEIQSFCQETKQPVPYTSGEIARCIFDSLALTYYDYMKELQQLTGVKPEVLHIVGGGANNGLLNQLTADLLEIEVQAGPSESTATGNLIVQMMTSGEIDTLSTARSILAKSFDIVSYYPRHVEGKQELLTRWAQL